MDETHRERGGPEVFSLLVNFRLCSQIEEMPEEDEEGDGEDIEADFDDSEMTTTAVDPSEMKEVQENALSDSPSHPTPCYIFNHLSTP